MVNKKNVRKIIRWIKKDRAAHLRMQDFCMYIDEKLMSIQQKT